MAKEAEKNQDTRHRRRVLQGLVVSAKMSKTGVIKVDRQVKHPVYDKYVKKTKKYKFHDEKDEAVVGDLVDIVETRPLSKSKRFALHKVVRKSDSADQLLNQS